METKINIAALSGSSRKNSSTQKALKSLNKFMPNSVEYWKYTMVLKNSHILIVN
ncbi:NAD(P)H-dependent FMN reductase [Paenibacillus sp. PvP094]|uniref:hypothetical protein n=1 Tax=Paenibacillus TaxID=44249 RepID=UPI003393C828